MKILVALPVTSRISGELWELLREGTGSVTSPVGEGGCRFVVLVEWKVAVVSAVSRPDWLDLFGIRGG